MDDYVREIKKGLESTISYFDNSSKPDRELWVLRQFLEYYPNDFSEDDLRTSHEEPHDVFCGNHGFQIKEVMDKSRRRHQEYKEKLAEIGDDTKPEDLLEDYNHKHISLDEALPRLATELERHRNKKYGGDASEIDVLVYLNLSDTTYTDDELTKYFEEFRNWRSVSVVTNNCAGVLSCSDKSDELLIPRVGKLFF